MFLNCIMMQFLRAVSSNIIQPGNQTWKFASEYLWSQVTQWVTQVPVSVIGIWSMLSPGLIE